MEDIILKTGKKRNNYFDFIKGIAIILVVFGHCIQYGSGILFIANEDYYDDVIFKLIYSFHMPLFALISGYFFYKSVRKSSFKGIIWKQCTMIGIPVISWNLLYYIVITSAKIFLGRDEFGFQTIKDGIKSIWINLWFLWIILLLSLIVIVIHWCFKDNVIGYILILAITLLLPDNYNFCYVGFLYPFYILGYFSNNWIERLNCKKFKPIVLIITGAIWICLLLYYNKDSFIYTTGFSLVGKNTLEQIKIDIFRFLIGLFGCIFVLLLVSYGKRIINNQIICELGKITLGIYIISSYICQLILVKATSSVIPNYLLNFIECIVILGICVIGIYFIKKSRILNKLLLGGR